MFMICLMFCLRDYETDYMLLIGVFYDKNEYYP